MAGSVKLAIEGGAPAVKMPSPDWPVSGDLEAAWMEGVVRSGKWSWIGPHETAFCKEFAEFIGSRFSLLLANGTVTLQCALQAVGVKPGDEVIVPGITWVATMQSAIDIGADAVIVDVDPETYCMDPDALEKAITPKTRAIVPVHIYGCMCDMDAIMDIAAKHNLKVVEDVAHQHGSRWKNAAAGAIGDAGSFSFQQSKVLTCGEGGAVTCSDKSIYETTFCLKHVGWMPDLETVGNRYGHNYRATEMQAVLLRGGLKRLPEQIRIREENASYLREALAEIGGPLKIAPRDPRTTCQSYYAMTLKYDKKSAFSIERRDYLDALAAEGFRLGTPYQPVYRNPLLNLYDETSPVAFRNKKSMRRYFDIKLPVTERVVNEEGVVLPHTELLGCPAYMIQLKEALLKVNDDLKAVKRFSLKRKKEMTR